MSTNNTTPCCEKCQHFTASCDGYCTCHQTHTTKEGWEERFDETLKKIEYFYLEPIYGSEVIRELFASEIQKAQVEVLDELYKAYKFADEDIEAGAMLHAMKQIRARITNKQSEI